MPDVPAALLKLLSLRSGSTVGIAMEGSRLVVEPRPHDTLEKLLAQCNPKAARTREDREWLRSKPAGAELI